MKKFEGVLICTDLDGTLLNEERRISKENLEAIRYFQREGGFFTFVTGRTPYSARPLYEMIHPNAPVGCGNGGGIYDYQREAYLYMQELSHDAMELVDHALQQIPGMGVQLHTPECVYFASENEATEHSLRVTGLPRRICSHKSFEKKLLKVVFCDTDMTRINALGALFQAHPKKEDFHFVRSEDFLYEILPKGSNKGVLVLKLAELLGIDPSKTIAVGDYNNDVEMIRDAGIGIAVSNAVPEAKAVADLITVSNEENAIAKIIWDLDSGALKFSEN